MRDRIELAIKEILQSLGLPLVDFSIEHPAEKIHGDYSTNVALVLAKPVKQNPKELAEQLRQTLTDKIQSVEKLEVAGPGFINFYLKREFFVSEVEKVSSLDFAWGKNTDWTGKKVLVEYTDPNPFKEFHIGHLFTNVVGESLARLFMMQGADVKCINYQGDIGLHVAKAIWGMLQLGISPESEFAAPELGRAYALGATKYKESEDIEKEVKAINKKIYDRSDEQITALYDAGRGVSLGYFEKIYQVIGTKFADYFFESVTGPLGKELVMARPDIFKESNGARIFPGEDYGLHTRVFINNEGLPTYEAKELALAKLKEERLGVYDWSVIITANEVNEYFKVLLKAMDLIYPDLAVKTEHIGHGMVRLKSGKMSSRTGEVIPALDFIADVTTVAIAKIGESDHTEPDPELAKTVAIGAIKYETLNGSIKQDSIFDKEQALSFEGNSGPYLQYTHARICSLLTKAENLGITAGTGGYKETPYMIERVIYQFPEVIKLAFLERAPHKITTYLTELATEFNKFYAQEKIVDKTDLETPYKLALCRAVKTTLRNGLWVLGIEAPEKM